MDQVDSANVCDNPFDPHERAAGRVHTPAEEGQPLKEETPGRLDAFAVGAPVLQAPGAVVLQHVQALAGRDVPVPLLFDLCEDPRLNQRRPGDHACRNLHSRLTTGFNEEYPCAQGCFHRPHS